MRHDRRSTPPGLVLGGVCYAIRFRCLRCLRVATRRGRVCGDRAVRGRLRCPGAAAGPGCVCGGRAVRGRLRCPGAAARPGWVVWCPFGMREAVVPEGGGRAWPGFEPTRRAEGSRRGRRAGGPPPSGTEKGHQHCAVTIENGDPTHQQHGRQGPHVRSSHVHNVEACITNLFHVINFQCIHSYDI